MTAKNYFIYTKKKINFFILPEESTLVVALAVAVALALVRLVFELPFCFAWMKVIRRDIRP